MQLFIIVYGVEDNIKKRPFGNLQINCHDNPPKV